MATFFRKMGELFSVAPEDYEVDVSSSGEGLGFLQETDEMYQADWTDLRYAKLLSHQCIFAQFVDGKASVLVNLDSPMVPFLDLFDAMMDAREEFQHGTAEVHKRPRFYAPSTAKGVMVLSVAQKREIEEASASWEYGRNPRDNDGEFLDMSAEYVSEFEREEMEEVKRAGHKKDDDVFTGDTDVESGGSSIETRIAPDIASRGDLDIEGGVDLQDIPEVVPKHEYRAPDTIADSNIGGSFDTGPARDEEGSSLDIVLKTYIFATVSEYDIFCIFTSMELSDALFMSCMDNWLFEVKGTHVANAMEGFRGFLAEMYPVMSRRVSTRSMTDEGSEDDLESPISKDRIPPRGTRSTLFASSDYVVPETSVSDRVNGLISGVHNKTADGLRTFLGFDPAIHYMTEISEEYKKRGSSLLQIITLMDSVCNGVGNIIDEAYAQNSTPRAHISPPTAAHTLSRDMGAVTDGVIMPATIEIEWSQMKMLDDLINELRRWTKQTVKNATVIEKY